MLSTASIENLTPVMARLDRDNQSNLERFVTTAEASAALAAINARPDGCCDPKTASSLAQKLLGFYPAREVNDPEVFARGLTALFAAYHEDFVRKVCNPVTGLPSRLKWLPTIADAKEALKAERARRIRIWANAAYVIKCHEDSRKKALEEAEFERNRPAADERARRVAEILRGAPREISP